MAKRRHEEFKAHDFATKYLVVFSPLPTFRDLTPEAYREKVTALVREIEDKGARDRGEDPESGSVQGFLQGSLQAPQEVTEVDYGVAAEALLSGRPDAVSWFPDGSYLHPNLLWPRSPGIPRREREASSETSIPVPALPTRPRCGHHESR